MIQIDDRWRLRAGRILLSGMQALVRLPLMQRARDAAAGLNTAGFISGYRGSPLGGYDLQIKQQLARLAAAGIRFEPGVNEELAATAIWGTQQAPLLSGARHEGIFAIWYGKGPGVDRAGDAIKHGNRMGSSKHGGVLVVFGDDHPGKSSSTAHQSEQALAANGLPVLYPATVQEYLDLGLHGFALSRYAGVWVGFKCVNESAESTATVEGDIDRVRILIPEATLPPGGVNARLAFDPAADELRLVRHKLPLVHAYAHANNLDRVTHGRGGSLGIVAAGKSWLDVLQALALLGLNDARLAQLGVAVYKPALIWPLEPRSLLAFAREQHELLFVEEKAAYIESQAAHILYNLADRRPRITGKHDDAARPLLRSDGVLEPLDIALAIGARLQAIDRSDAALQERMAELASSAAVARQRGRGPVTRLPYFCAGCPHSTSTKVPEGSIALAGIGCHTMALFMDRDTLPPTHMGGEGVNWTGIAPFTDTTHVFQNLGDGTYFHSGLLAIRAAVNAQVNITYKILVNDAVAMTGGQRVEGALSVAEITHQLRAERVRRIAVVSDDCSKFGRDPGFAAGVTLHDRRELDALQRELRNIAGVTAIVYDQVCAAENRRRRKRGSVPPATRRVFINELVCEGCGDCSTAANCVAIEPLDTEFGRKRRIDQSGCNHDQSCTNGFCPAFVTVVGGRLRKPAPPVMLASQSAALPVPQSLQPEPSCSVLIAGIGGTGIVTVGALIAMAAHLDGFAATTYDMTGLAQKGGAVLSHIKVARSESALTTPRIGALETDVLLACDLVAAGSAESLATIRTQHTHAVLNTHSFPTASFQLDPDFDGRTDETLAMVEAAAGVGRTVRVDATRCSVALLGDAIAANVFILGFALQKGWLPVSLGAIERAIDMNAVGVELNRRALDLGRLAAHAPEQIETLLTAAGNSGRPPGTEPPDPLAVREAFLTEYQDREYAARYRALVERVIAAERELAAGHTGLGAAVVRYYFKLLAYKDEYEVARLHSGEALRRELAATFDGDYELRFNLAPPGLTRNDPATGKPRKVEIGAWVLPAFRVLAKLRRLRGTWLDPFGYSSERRMERDLIAAYERLLDELIADLSPDRHSLAVELASLPEQIRGFGHIKHDNVTRVRLREAELLQRWRASAHGDPQAGESGPATIAACNPILPRSPA